MADGADDTTETGDDLVDDSKIEGKTDATGEGDAGDSILKTPAADPKGKIPDAADDKGDEKPDPAKTVDKTGDKVDDKKVVDKTDRTDDTKAKTGADDEPDLNLESGELPDPARVKELFAKNAPKGLITLAETAITRAVAAEELIDAIGGPESLKAIDKVASMLTSGDASAAEQVHDMLEKANPLLLKNLATYVFWDQTEDPVVVDQLVKALATKEGLKEAWTFEKVATLLAACEAGDVDFDEIAEKAASRETPEAKKEREARALEIQTLNEKIATLEGKVGTGDGEDPVVREAITKDVQAFATRYRAEYEPILKQHGLLPVDGEPEAVSKAKALVVRNILRDMDYLNVQSEPWKAADRMIRERATTADAYEWTTKKALVTARIRLKEIVKEYAPLVVNTAKGLNQPAALNQSKRRPEVIAPGKDESGKAKAAGAEGEVSDEDRRDPDKRRERMRAIVEAQTAKTG